MIAPGKELECLVGKNLLLTSFEEGKIHSIDGCG